ncbi:hypothetical protein PHSY_000342 [Pseudozyma hubeiensis SY62]|uniref:Uncharacterized protein n=1 Tax=Pseudozyma hubeiensis (strain SY62) TaxID=1305764 RepID=R9NWC3_PSEHS|nr:hypothetical protein PHSY_000342 [Pseudozyma hubeiensis SY62]GAC92786.1 hypothetical protein PHSY_000342 [Pseudozyma hubeiensis SY62]
MATREFLPTDRRPKRAGKSYVDVYTSKHGISFLQASDHRDVYNSSSQIPIAMVCPDRYKLSVACVHRSRAEPCQQAFSEPSSTAHRQRLSAQQLFTFCPAGVGVSAVRCGDAFIPLPILGPEHLGVSLAQPPNPRLLCRVSYVPINLSDGRSIRVER